MSFSPRKPRATAVKAGEKLKQIADDDHEIFGGGRKRAAPARFGAEDAPWGGGRRASSTAGISKRKRCGECAGCRARNCGKCIYCKDMPMYGGKGNMRQSCKERKCEVIVAAEERANEERVKVREEERQVRERERGARMAERATHRAATSGQRARAAATSAELGGVDERVGGARLPAVRLAPSTGGGWGLQHPPVGAPVEVRLSEEGLEDACWAATVVDDADDDGLLLVEVEELTSEEDAAVKIRERVPPSAVRMRPPRGFPAGAVELVRPGDLLELYFDDAWWEVKVDAVLSSAAAKAATHLPGAKKLKDASMRFKVTSTKYRVEHEVRADALRPHWLWSTKWATPGDFGGVWRYELVAGHGCVPADARRGLPTFKFAGGVQRMRVA